MNIPVIDHTCGRRFTVEASQLNDGVRCACGSDDLDLDDRTAAAEHTCEFCDRPAVFQAIWRDTSGQTEVRRRYTCVEHDQALSNWSGQVQISRVSAWESDLPMDRLGDVASVSQHVRCSTCLTETTIVAVDPAQPMPTCPSCGADTLTVAGATLAARDSGFGQPHDDPRKVISQGICYCGDTAGHYGSDQCRPASTKWDRGEKESKLAQRFAWAQDAADPNFWQAFSFVGSELVTVAAAATRSGNFEWWVMASDEGGTTRELAQGSAGSLEAAKRAAESAASTGTVTSQRATEAKVAEIVAGIRATNPGMPEREAVRIARETVRRYPKVASEDEFWVYTEDGSTEIGGPYSSLDAGKRALIDRSGEGVGPLKLVRSDGSGGLTDTGDRVTGARRYPKVAAWDVGDPVPFRFQPGDKVTVKNWNGAESTGTVVADPAPGMPNDAFVDVAFTGSEALGDYTNPVNRRDIKHAGSPDYYLGSRRTAESTPMECYECGHKFKKKIGPNTSEVKCPKCGGYDTNVAGY